MACGAAWSCHLPGTVKLISFFSLDAALLPDGRVGLTHKIVDGIERMVRHWPGELVAVFAPRMRADTNLDQESFWPGELPFTVVVGEPAGEALAQLIEGAALVQTGVDYRHLRVARACRRAGVPYVMVAEYNLKTRLQIAAAEEESIARRVRRAAWEISQEARQRLAIVGAAGLQCNGTPAFEAWAGLNKNPLLFFDSRVHAELLATDDDAAQRGRNAELSLAFSGRFIPMKGVLHLPDVAVRLRARGVPFKLRIFGGGPLEAALRERVAHLGLEREVSLAGTLPFPQLMAEVTATIDLFVCPHVQGDPSCTYLETMACGVPIAGYDNDAWRGLLARSGAGWSAPLGDPAALADTVVQAAGQRRQLAEAAGRALAFARMQTFELTFERRMEHLLDVKGSSSARRRGFGPAARFVVGS